VFAVHNETISQTDTTDKRHLRYEAKSYSQKTARLGNIIEFTVAVDAVFATGLGD
jgi:hypothetical protein